METATLLPVDTEVEIVTFGQNQKTPYIGRTGRVVGVVPEKNWMWVILDDDPVPRWRNLGIFCFPHEVRAI